MTVLSKWLWFAALAGALAVPSGASDQVASRGTSARGGHKYTNRLIREKSPYLQLHAHNPVDWYPWGEEAFTKARREGKPILLSIGYYTCHWCHVMERESYSNPEIAKLLNRSFVSIKVDREERPDVDRAYIAFILATTGGAGWPANVFLTPDLKPFFGGTYFPPEDRHGRAGLKTLLPRIAELWTKQRDEIERSASRVTEQLQRIVEPQAGKGAIQPATVRELAYTQIQQTYDDRNGGFGRAPKFPRPVTPAFLLRYWARTGKSEALDAVRNTLRAMAAGGIHDHLGGGFHRYSTDAFWRVPHFEKMLYDQAQLAIIYTEAYQATHDPFFAETARDILDFSLRELRGPEGAFYSALDADSPLPGGGREHGEGAYYVWAAAEIQGLLGSDAPLFMLHYAVQPYGNVPPGQDIEGWLRQKNVLYVAQSVEETARHFGTSPQQARASVERSRQRLLKARALRPRPPLDDKVITGWNGLMLSALARASQTLEEPRYLQAAMDAARFLRARLYSPKVNRLKRRYRAGSVGIDGHVDDYAQLIQGLLDLYEASFEPGLLTWAVRLQEAQDQLFWDAEKGGYHTVQPTRSKLPIQPREAHDGAEPSPNSIAALNLLRLASITDRDDWQRKAARLFETFGGTLEKQPEAMPYLVAALDFSQGPQKQIVIAGDPGASDTETLLRLVRRRYLPNRILLLADGAGSQKQLAAWNSVIANMTRLRGKATAYLCEDYVCKLPTSDPHVFAGLLNSAMTPAPARTIP